MAGVKQPADKSYFILPDLGEGVAEAELIEWKVQPGDNVAEHQTLAEMETDKARVEVPSPWAGVIGELHGSAGDIIAVGSKLVSYSVAGSDAASKKSSHTAKDTAATSSNGAQSAPAGKKVAAAKTAGASAEKDGDSEAREDAGTVVGTVGGDVAVSDRFARRAEAAAGASAGGKALATPAVRRIARELGIDINRVPGSGRGGRVTASDVESFVQSGAGTARRSGSTTARAAHDRAEVKEIFAKPNVASSSTDGIAKRIPFRGIRRKIAQALTHSVQTAVHFTVVNEADVTELEVKRKELMYATGEKFSLLPFIMTAICRALRDHPSVNANVDDENGEILIKSVINLGCAVDTDDGLMVPVLFDADGMSILELAQRVKDVAQRCHNRTIPREELMGGTFTISNVGSYGGMFATPIINYPEVAILAAGRAYDKVLAKNGGFHLGKVLPLSLSCDHRVVDGAEGTRFLNTVVKLLESPVKLLQP